MNENFRANSRSGVTDRGEKSEAGEAKSDSEKQRATIRKERKKERSGKNGVMTGDDHMMGWWW